MKRFPFRLCPSPKPEMVGILTNRDLRFETLRPAFPLRDDQETWYGSGRYHLEQAQEICTCTASKSLGGENYIQGAHLRQGHPEE
jgi:hypothetical protein